MCGIAGIVWKDANRPAATEDVGRMCDVMYHRGPDAGAVVAHGAVALGHRRLSILDLSDAGTQPMSSRDGRHILVFNGEIYNYLELRDELSQLGGVFQTETDTEVILEAYRLWGPECVRKFNGMWAFALYDMIDASLFISRDRFGIKPFYYLFDDDSFVFASEIKSIVAVRPAERVPHWGVLARFLPSGLFADGKETFFANVRALLAGHNARYDVRRGTWETHRYWTADRERFVAARGNEDPVEQLRELLDSSIRLHLRSDVPVGTCLSGGIDSSAIVGLMSRLRCAPVHTFSGIYPDEGFTEQEYVDEVNRHAATLPRPVFPEPAGDMVDDLTRITWHQDNPTAGPGLYTQYHVMRRAGQEVKVILDGQGADELFAGYLFYFRAHLLDLAATGLLGRLRAMRLMLSIRRHWGGASVPAIFSGGVGKVLQRLLCRPSPPLPVSVEAIVHPDLLDWVARNGNGPLTRNDYPPVRGHLNAVLWDQIVSSSLPALLHYEDRNSMAFSLEARVPFLDYRIVEFALGLDPSYKISSSWTKWVLRKAAAEVLPRKVAWRRSKLGYPTPMARWFRKASEKRCVEDILFSSSLADRDVIQPEVLRSVWDHHQAGHDFSWLLYRVLTTELWFRHFIDDFSPAPASTRAQARPTETRSVALCG
jgi:asparagine synthase (glutamine-hydrolysing)